MAGQGPYNPMGGQPPQMQQMQQQQPQHSAEMQRQMAMMQARQNRKGTSKAVPIVVSAGLAVGTFCGLLFGLGTGEAAPPSKGNNLGNHKATEDEIPAALQTKVNDTPAPKPNPPANGSGSAVAANAGSGSGSAAAPVAKPKLVVELTPDTASSGAHIFVDGKEITGKELEYEVDPATNKAKTAEVVVTVKADGFKDGEQKVKLDGDTTIKFEMVKGKTTLPKDVVAKDAGSGSAAPAAVGSGSATPAVAVTPPVKKDPPPVVVTPPAKKDPPPAVVTPPAKKDPPPVHHNTPKPPPKKGGLIDI